MHMVFHVRANITRQNGRVVNFLTEHFCSELYGVEVVSVKNVFSVRVITWRPAQFQSMEKLDHEITHQSMHLSAATRVFHHKPHQRLMELFTYHLQCIF